VLDVGHPPHLVAHVELGLGSPAPRAQPAVGDEQVLDDARPVRRRRAVGPRREVEVVDLDRRAVGDLVGVEEPRADALGGDLGTDALGEQDGERHAERAREGVERRERRVAGALLDLRERALADARRRREARERQPALGAQRPDPLRDGGRRVVPRGGTVGPSHLASVPFRRRNTRC